MQYVIHGSDSLTKSSFLFRMHAVVWDSGRVSDQCRRVKVGQNKTSKYIMQRILVQSAHKIPISHTQKQKNSHKNTTFTAPIEFRHIFDRKNIRRANLSWKSNSKINSEAKIEGERPSPGTTESICADPTKGWNRRTVVGDLQIVWKWWSLEVFFVSRSLGWALYGLHWPILFIFCNLVWTVICFQTEFR